MVGDGVRVEVISYHVVHVDEGVGHQRVVGDVPVALVVGAIGRASANRRGTAERSLMKPP